MCEFSEHIVLSENQQGQLSWCKCCQNYSLIYKSCCVAFSDQEFYAFRNTILKLREEDYHYHFFDKKYAIIKNETAPMGIILTAQDREELLDLLNEAKAIKEVFSIIYN
ncbi:MAG: DUF6686 family protein [Bacteroidota bacterium]